MFLLKFCVKILNILLLKVLNFVLYKFAVKSNRNINFCITTRKFKFLRKSVCEKYKGWVYYIFKRCCILIKIVLVFINKLLFSQQIMKILFS